MNMSAPLGWQDEPGHRRKQAAYDRAITDRFVNRQPEEASAVPDR
jgi:hypothetical protein